MKNEYAFPAIGDGPNAPHFAPGLTIRDYFAAAALQGLMADNDFSPLKREGETFERATARICYGYANAMLAAREKGVE